MDTPKAPRRRLSRRGWAALSAAVIAVVVGGAVAVWRSGGLLPLAARTLGAVISPLQPRGVRTPPPVPLQLQEPISVLVLGREVAPSYAGPELTDSMLILSFDPATKQAAILSIPRDLWINIPTFGYERIDAALENVGPSSTELTVDEYLAVPIEYYAIVNYTTFIHIVNDVGGVSVDVPQPIYDSCFPNAAEDACTVLRIASGEQHMDGQLALDFARERHSFANGDIQRGSDQQLVLLGLKNQMLLPQNWLKIPEMIDQLRGLVQTNFPYADVPLLATEVLRIPDRNVHSGVLSYQSGAITNYTTPGSVSLTAPTGAEVLLPNEGPIRAIAAQTFPWLFADIHAMTVQVEGGVSADQEIAGQFTQILHGMGVKTLAPTQAAHADLKTNAVYVNTSVVHLGKGRAIPSEAFILGQMLGVPAQLAAIPSSTAEIVVELGADYAGYTSQPDD